MNNIAVIGCSGAIGNAFVQILAERYPNATVHAFSRSHTKTNDQPNVKQHTIDYKDETSIKTSVDLAAKDSLLDMVIVATGILHQEGIMPEKSLRDLSEEKFHRLFEVNTIVPAMLMKHFLPVMNRGDRSVFAAISARVGSIGDNQLGGWYAYRMSKAALNMMVKNASIEMSRRNKQAIVIALHPGTVDSCLSKPFQSNVAEGRLFTPEFAVKKMIEVLENLDIGQSGKCFAWDGEEIVP